MPVPAEDRRMNLRLGSLLPRVFVLVIVALLATATITFAAETSGTPTPNTPTESAAPTILLVPDVRGQAYVFAKTTLEEGGFAWRVAGGVKGYAANTVTGQSPAPGSRVYDTGAPTVSLSLSVNSRYPQAGSPEQAAPFAGTPVELVGVTKPKAKPTAKAEGEAEAKPKAKPKKKAKPARSRSPRRSRSRPRSRPGPRRSSSRGPSPSPSTRSRSPSEPRTSAPGSPATAARRTRTSVTGSTSTPGSSPAQNSAGGTARGLETLIAVDEKVQRSWGMGKRSERVARAALAEVRKRSK